MRVLAPFGVLNLLPGKKSNIDDILTKFSQSGSPPDQKIVEGTISSKGRILCQVKNGRPQIRYQGQLSLDDLQITDRLQPKDFSKRTPLSL